MTIEDLWTKWWAAQSEGQRAQLKRIADQDRPDAAAMQTVLDAKPPIGLVGSKWETEPDLTWSISPTLRIFIQAQP
ncbi:hypothetical protein [Mycobacterium sp. NPDC050853]|uniref:hypothetical protein n=1 Tax=Mycobacterium sp. NPDC050853 TaxID=3155160 RepID=UPI0033D52542